MEIDLRITSDVNYFDSYLYILKLDYETCFVTPGNMLQYEISKQNRAISISHLLE